MKISRIIICFFILVLMCSCYNNTAGNTQANDSLKIKKTDKQLKEEREALLVQKRLQAKADTAKAYCIKNKLDVNFCMLVDMSVHSGKNRFFVWDFAKDTVAHSGVCCHGYGMGSSETKPVFSNKPGSYCTSLGKYKTGARSYSNWGTNVHYKLHGLDATNSNAFRRIVVLHSHSPVPDKEIYPEHLPLGYSQGCPVIDNGLMTILDEMLKKSKKPMLLWIYNS